MTANEARLIAALREVTDLLVDVARVENARNRVRMIEKISRLLDSLSDIEDEDGPDVGDEHF